MATSRLLELTAIIARETQKVNDFFTESGITPLSFDPSAPADFPAPSSNVEIQEARRTVINAAQELQKMGGVGALMDKLPAAATQKAGAINAEQGDRDLRRQIAIINSMTRKERRNPSIIDGSRRRRIAGGSGTQVQDVNRLLKQFMEMQRVMKSMKGGKLRQLMSALKGAGGGPRGFPGR